MTRLPAALVIALLATPALAADFQVLNNNDSGPGSLRQALTEALADQDMEQYIRFDASFPLDASIELLSPLPSLAGKTQVAILGDGRNPRILASGSGLNGILRAEQSLARLLIDDLRLEGGRHPQGGGCIRGTHNNLNLPAILNVGNSEFVDCGAPADGTQAVGGGAISWNSPAGEVLITDTVFRNNGVSNGPTGSAYGSGGALWVAGEMLTIRRSGFYSNDVQMVTGAGGAVATGIQLLDLSIVDSVFVNNRVLTETANQALGGAVSAGCFEDCEIVMERNYFGENSASHGGALYLRRGNSSSVNIAVDLVNNTFLDNSASAFGGAAFLGRSAFKLAFNTLENNQAATGAHLYLLNGRAGQVTHNVFGGATGLPCYFYTISTDTLSGGRNAFADSGCESRLQPDASVVELGSYSLDVDAPMPVVAYAIDSPVTDGGDDCVGIDARQTERPLDGDGDGVALCDIGAYERPAAPPTLIFRSGFED